MADKIRYPIGIQTFSEIIEEGYKYVDKTELMYELTKYAKYIFLSRPRRFGKSLLTSTLESYFKGEKELFKGLAIEKLEKEWKSYPVLRFDLSPANYDDPSKLIARLNGGLQSLELEYSLTSMGDTVSERFISLIQQAYHKYDKKVVILIDEYDKPMLDCLHNIELHEKLKSELRGFYSAIKASDKYIKFAMLTGITKFGKVNVFSGLNNLKDISMLPKYNAICGISETEFHKNFKESIAKFATIHGIPEDEAWSQFKLMYDGYHFATNGEGIYNPFSVLNAFDDMVLDSYWYESGSPYYLINLIEKNNYALDKLDGAKRTKAELSNITDTSSDIVPLLFQSGYLTINDYDSISDEYTLGFPNREVNKAFWNSLASRFFRGIDGSRAFNLHKCLKEINEGKPEDFMLSLKSLFADTNSEIEKNKEIHFQNMMAIACKMMGLNVRTEIHSSVGRCDMQILTPIFVYIFEFKINSSPEKAIEQILEKGYANPFSGDPRTVYVIGANFSTETCTLEGWIIQKEH